MPPNKRNCVLTLVVEKLAARQLNNPKHSLMRPGHKWIFPQGDLQKGTICSPQQTKGAQTKGAQTKGAA
jgi:hypothetical protein